MMKTDNFLVRIVDDDEAVREGAAFMLSCKGFQVRTYPSAEAFLEADDAKRPGCLVLDIRMPEMSGLELQARMRRQEWLLPIIFLTGHGDVGTAVLALRKGAFDFLQKPVENDRLIISIEEACELSLIRMRGELTGEEAMVVLSEMSDREKEIIPLIENGVPNSAMAERLGVSLRTIQGHRNNIYKKLRVHSEEGLRLCMSRVREARA